MPRYKGPPPIPDPDTFPPGTVLDIYLRASPGEEQELSVPAQLEEAQRYFDERGWMIGDVFSDDDHSGADPGRRDLNRLLQKYGGEFAPSKGIVIWSYARLSRESSISHEILYVTRRAGIPLHSISDTVPNELRDLLEPIRFMVAQEQLKQLRKDTKRGMEAMIRQGFAPGGFPPVGYRTEWVRVGFHRNGTPRDWPRWVIDPERRDMVTMAWKMGLEGAAQGSILARTLLFPNRSSLASFFKNPAYCGFPTWYLNYHKLQVAACVGRTPVVEPYVSIADWLRMQKGRGARPGAVVDPRREFGGWPLSGRIDCGYCGAACHASAHVESRYCEECGELWPSSKWQTCPSCGAPYSRRGGNYCYGCGAHKALASRCPESGYTAGQKLELGLLREIAPQFTADRLTEIVTDINTALAAMHQSGGQQRETVQGRLREAEASVANLLDALDRGGWSEAISARLRTREQEVTALRAELAMLPESGSVPYIAAEETQALAELFQHRVPHLDRPGRRQLFEGLDIQVQLYREKAEATVQWPPLKLLLHIEQGRDLTSYYRLYPQPDSNRRSPP